MNIVTCARPKCSAGITWVRTANGRPMPLDPEPDPKGNVVLVNGLAVVLGGKGAEGVAAVDATRYMPHFVTCADPPQRKPKKPKR